MSNVSSTMMQGEGCPGDGWVERSITPTLLGYETLEERAKFTVYKILVTGSRGENWVIFRRYTDFCRLSDKLREEFPSFHLVLPPKRWFKDNYSEDLLEERQTGLQTFLQNLMFHKDIISSGTIRRFLCLFDTLSPFDSVEESRAFYKTLEESNHRLQRELLEHLREINTLKKILEEKEKHFHLLEKKVKSLSLSSESLKSHRQLVTKPTQEPREEETGVNGYRQMDGNEEDIMTEDTL